MKKLLLLLLLLIPCLNVFSQSYIQYNTGTLFDSFENPSQRSFIPDSSKQYAFNFLIPNFNANFYLTGNAQADLKNRAFNGRYLDDALMINQGKFNHVKVNDNNYFLMFKVFGSVNGDTEWGFSAQSRADAHGLYTDDTFALLNGPTKFTNATYNNIFNDNYDYQLYNQIGVSYREKITKDFAIGFRLNALFGIKYESVKVDESHIYFDPANDRATVFMQGTHYSSYVPGNFDGRDLLPSFRSPGASISIGTSYKTQGNILLQANIKDLGFIHWNVRSSISKFNSGAVINEISGRNREDSIFNAAKAIVNQGASPQSFTTPINGVAEFSAAKSFWIDGDYEWKYMPTVIASKELFYNGFTGALVNRVEYKNYSASLSASYDDLKLLGIGAQLMYKTPNFEFFFGSEKIGPSMSMWQASNKNEAAMNSISSYSGANFFLGLAIKFGPVIEHPMNSSTIPSGEKGFLGRLYNRLFKTYR